MAEELAQVDADDGPQHEHKLILIGELVLQVGCTQSRQQTSAIIG
jgi:hypothetical protein